MQRMIGGFAGAVDAFMRDLGTTRSRVTVVTISEFGRRVAENGNNGLDHGWGNMMLLMGGGVDGGRYHGAGRDWAPGSSSTATSRSRPTTATCSARWSPEGSRTGPRPRCSPVSSTARSA